MKLAKGTLRALVALLATLALVATAVYYKVDESGIGASGEQATITIAYLPITHAAPLFKAAEQLEQQNSNVHVELVKYGGWAELMDALDSGRVDGASVLIEMAMEAKSQGIPLELSLLGQRDHRKQRYCLACAAERQDHCHSERAVLSQHFGSAAA